MRCTFLNDSRMDFRLWRMTPRFFIRWEITTARGLRRACDSMTQSSGSNGRCPRVQSPRRTLPGRCCKVEVKIDRQREPFGPSDDSAHSAQSSGATDLEPLLKFDFLP